MKNYTFYKADKKICEDMGIPETPFPVRNEMKDQVFQNKKLDLNLLYDELQLFLSQNEDFNEHYAWTVVQLSYYLGMRAARDGTHDIALNYFVAGLNAQPDNISLRVNYAASLQSLGQTDQALEQFEFIINDPDISVTPLVWIVVARIYADKDDYTRSFQLLEQCRPMVADDDGLWNFYCYIREKAGVETKLDRKEEKVLSELRRKELLLAQILEKEKAMQADKVVDGQKCSQCKTDIPAGAQFCNNCGKKIESVAAVQAEAQVKFCPGCGQKLPMEAEFCSNCGTKSG